MELEQNSHSTLTSKKLHVMYILEMLKVGDCLRPSWKAFLIRGSRSPPKMLEIAPNFQVLLLTSEKDKNNFTKFVQHAVAKFRAFLRTFGFQTPTKSTCVSQKRFREFT